MYRHDLRAVQQYEKKEPKIPQAQILKSSRKKSVKSPRNEPGAAGGATLLYRMQRTPRRAARAAPARLRPSAACFTCLSQVCKRRRRHVVHHGARSSETKCGKCAAIYSNPRWWRHRVWATAAAAAATACAPTECATAAATACARSCIAPVSG